MSKASDLDKQKDQTIRAWKTSFFVISIIALLVAFNNYSLRKVIPLWLAPDLTVGKVVNAGQVDKAYVFHFAYNILSGISRWKKDGESDYKRNIFAYGNYISSNFRKQLLLDYKNRVSRGTGRLNELKGRTREVSLIALDSPASMVRKKSQGTYIVYLDVYDEEKINGSIVKSNAYRYTVNVEVDTSNLVDNDTGLRILGFAGSPVLIDK